MSTGEGISSWFVTAEVVPGESGTVRLVFGPGAEGTMPIEEWSPPHTIRFGSTLDGGRKHEFDVREVSGGHSTVRVRDWGLDPAEVEGARGAWANYLGRLKALAEAV